MILVFSAVIFASSMLAAVPAKGSGPALNSVQLFVQTSSPLKYNYFVSAYNASGSLVASYQSPYPGAGFELPAGTYLFTVSAVSYDNVYCRLCMAPDVSGTSTSVTSSGGSTSMPIAYYPPSSEYGFDEVDVTGPVSLSVQTMNATTFPTVPVAVQVQYANGTAAAGAYVSASVVGEWYYWWGPNTTVVMSAQTDASGVADLVIPEAPAVVSAWKWVPVDLNQSSRPAETSVGGKALNVTAYWARTYVGLAATGLLMPPSKSIQLTLHAQQQDFWAVPLGETVSASPGAAVSDGSSAVPSATQMGSANSYYLPSSIPSLKSGTSFGGAEGGPTGNLLGLGPVSAAVLTLAVLAGLGAGAVATIARKRRLL